MGGELTPHLYLLPVCLSRCAATRAAVFARSNPSTSMALCLVTVTDACMMSRL